MMIELRSALPGTLIVFLTIGCSPIADKPQSEAQPAPAAPSLVSPVSINAEMVRIVDHASHQLWNAEKPGMAPKTDADWDNIVEHACRLRLPGL